MLAEEWQALLNGNRELLSGLPAGARIGLVAAPCRRGASFYVWEIEEREAMAWVERFPGLEAPGVDLVLVANPEALAVLCKSADLAGSLRNFIRTGAVQLYVTGGPIAREPAFQDFLEEFALVFPRH